MRPCLLTTPLSPAELLKASPRRHQPLHGPYLFAAMVVTVTALWQVPRALVPMLIQTSATVVLGAVMGLPLVLVAANGRQALLAGVSLIGIHLLVPLVCYALNARVPILLLATVPPLATWLAWRRVQRNPTLAATTIFVLTLIVTVSVVMVNGVELLWLARPGHRLVETVPGPLVSLCVAWTRAFDDATAMWLACSMVATILSAAGLWHWTLRNFDRLTDRPRPTGATAAPEETLSNGVNARVTKDTGR